MEELELPGNNPNGMIKTKTMMIMEEKKQLKNIFKRKPLLHTTQSSNSGFVILFTVMLASVMLSIALGISSIALNEVKFSTSAKDTNNAFFAADTGIEKALEADRPPVLLVSASPGTEQTTTIVVTGLGSDGQSCAKVTTFKENITYHPFTTTTITSKGYNIGNAACDSSNPDRIERELLISY